MGRPAFQPTPEQRLKVSIWAACGMPQDYICTQIINPQTGAPITKKTLESAFRKELDEGMEQATAQVTMSLFKKATGNGPQSVTAAIFWLKCRAGWKPVEQVELTGRDGAPIETKNEAQVDEQAVRAIVKRLREEF